MSALAWIAVAGFAGSLTYIAWMVRTAPLHDADERPVDEVQDDPRPGEVLREAWADTAQVYAVADTVSAQWAYIEAGRMYPVISERGSSFHIKMPEGRSMLCLWNGCAHLEGGNWIRIEGGAA